MTAYQSSETVEVVAEPRRRIPGEEGIWVFVLGDMVIFALFFGTFMYSRAKNPEVFAQDHASLSTALGTINTVLLLTSSLLVVLGVRKVMSRDHASAPRLFGGALLCGLAFICVKAAEWSHLFGAGKSVGGGEYYSYYYMFTGIHLLHVVLGCIVLIKLIVDARRPMLTGQQIMLSEAGGIFWHMVDLLWVVLFALFYLMR
ncbi:cytochrome c oxidase subunit 3 [Mycobacterium sp. SMC-8]|uniref:cytochrome c oxidase subunit 3 n=1 Tax=Mycobacterium sp. SMC-8 TaxID=2857060 RepID=UPI0021B1970F|nr:cytochrome c oxidase subunit 3 [Mycobacterium sp. SMC-8]UXA11509.1 cytochrome c oxidase subunit 3 [Mycobacterium sp. SMC-8]